MNDTVTQPNDATNPSGNANSDGGQASDAPETPSVDQLLNEYEQNAPAATTPPAPSTPAPAPAPAETPAVADPRVDNMEMFVEQMQRKQTNEDIQKAVNTIKSSDSLGGVSDKIVRGYLTEKANSDPRFLQAFQARNDNPESWSNILSAVAAEMEGELGTTQDANVTKNIASVRATVNTQSQNSNAGKTDADILNMSDAEFDAHVASQGGSNGPSYFI